MVRAPCLKDRPETREIDHFHQDALIPILIPLTSRPIQSHKAFSKTRLPHDAMEGEYKTRVQNLIDDVVEGGFSKRTHEDTHVLLATVLKADNLMVT